MEGVQGSGKLVLELPRFRYTAHPQLHPSHGHRAFSSKGRCLATLATKIHTKEEKDLGKWGWLLSGDQRGLGHLVLDLCPTCFSSFSLSVQLSTPGCLPARGSQVTSS